MQDSNLLSHIQSVICYHYINPEYVLNLNDISHILVLIPLHIIEIVCALFQRTLSLLICYILIYEYFAILSTFHSIVICRWIICSI